MKFMTHRMDEASFVSTSGFAVKSSLRLIDREICSRTEADSVSVAGLERRVHTGDY
jgi:hypothetical protein